MYFCLTNEVVDSVYKLLMLFTFSGYLLAIDCHINIQQKLTVDLYASLILLDPDKTWLKLTFILDDLA